MIEVTAAVIQKDNEVLICQRPANKSCEYLWEFPGGKVEPGETKEQCIVRECQEELGVLLKVQQKITDVVYKYVDRTIHLHFYLCSICSGVPEQKEHAAFRWISREEISDYIFCPADQKMLSATQNLKEYFCD